MIKVARMQTYYEYDKGPEIITVSMSLEDAKHLVESIEIEDNHQSEDAIEANYALLDGLKDLLVNRWCKP